MVEDPAKAYPKPRNDHHASSWNGQQATKPLAVGVARPYRATDWWVSRFPTRMSFVVELSDLPLEDDCLARRVEMETAKPGLVRVRRVKGGVLRWRCRFWLVEAFVRDENGEPAGDVLSDEADWKRDSYSLSPEGADALAQTIITLGQIAPPGWTFKASWVGDDVEREEAVTAERLAELARRSALRKTMRYRVIASSR